jgi:co-chaperonin GroES (HSP10)
MLIPTTHRIVVKQQLLENVSAEHKRATAIGLVLVDTAEKKREQAGVDQGVVVAIGPTAFKDFGVDCPISVGDNIAFAKYSGKVVTDPDDNKVYVILNDEDVVCLVKETNTKES